MLGLAAFLGFMAYGNVGTYSEDADPLFGGGEVGQDYEPTSAESVRVGVKVFVAVAVLLIAGAHSGFKNMRK